METQDLADKLDHEESKNSRASKRSKKSVSGTANSEEGEEQMEKKASCANWLTWNEEEAIQFSKSDNLNEQKRAFYKMGLSAQANDENDAALEFFNKVIELDPSFC